jgi:Protein of unknown function (DUF4019)
MLATRFVLSIAAAMFFSASSVQSDETAAKPAPRVINITSDSAPGWLPSVAQSDTAEQTARDYLAAEDAGRAEDAYGYFADLNKQHTPLADYKTNMEKMNAELGPVIERRIVKVTWTKDSPQAPIPGVYAAIDLISRFANADRHCGYLILYQAPVGDDFKVMREEANFMDNKTANASGAEEAWAKLSVNCPNYPGPVAKP